MSLIEQIDADFLTAYKAHDELKTSVLRLLKSSLKNKSIEKKDNLTEEEAFKVLRKEVKQRQDSAKEYSDAGRPDSAEKELSESKIIEAYLPAEMSEDVIRGIAVETLQDLGITEMKDMGRAMGAVIGKTNGQADGGLVSKIVRELLNK
ncbi:MAG: GatB/YqeY domain-containing protein [Patescibacteria group bacterium]|jgi:hypothetical protein